MDSFILKKIVTAVNSTTTLVEPGDVDQPFQLGSIWLSLLVLIPILFLPFFFFALYSAWWHVTNLMVDAEIDVGLLVANVLMNPPQLEMSFTPLLLSRKIQLEKSQLIAVVIVIVSSIYKVSSHLSVQGSNFLDLPHLIVISFIINY